MRTAFSVLIGLVVTFVAVVLVTVVYYPHRTIPNHTTYLLLGGGVVLSAAILPLVHRVPTARLERADWIVRRVSSVLLASVVIGMVLLTVVLFLGLTGGALGVVLIGVGVISLLGGYGVIALAGAAERGGAGVGSSGEC